MLVRCYSKKFKKHRPTYKDCCVCEEWLTFSNFKVWMEQQDWEDKELDKDLMIHGNKVYSPETCLFVSRELNTFMTDRQRFTGDLPIGVSRKGRKFSARVNLPSGGREFIGVFENPQEAHAQWKKRKLELAIENFSENHNSIVIDAIYRKYGR